MGLRELRLVRIGMKTRRRGSAGMLTGAVRAENGHGMGDAVSQELIRTGLRREDRDLAAQPAQLAALRSGAPGCDRILDGIGQPSSPPPPPGVVKFGWFKEIEESKRSEVGEFNQNLSTP